MRSVRNRISHSVDYGNVALIPKFFDRRHNRVHSQPVADVNYSVLGDPHVGPVVDVLRIVVWDYAVEVVVPA